MQRFEQMEERMEIVLTSRQIFVLAVLLVGVALVMFVVGFSMGKRSERRKVVLGTPQAAADLLTRLDEMEKESKEFVAKKALTQIRKQEISVEQQNATDPAEKSPASAAPAEPRVAPAGSKVQGTIALSKVRSMAPASKTPIVKAPVVKTQAVRAPLVKNAPAAPVQGKQVTGSFGRPRRAEAVAARKTESKKAAAQN